MLLSRNALTCETLINTLKSHTISIQDIQEKSLYITLNHISCYIKLEPDTERLNLVLIQDLGEYDEQGFFEALIASNKANYKKTFLKTSVIRKEDRLLLMYEYHYRYNRGFNLTQFISDLTFFEKVVLAIRKDEFASFFNA